MAKKKPAAAAPAPAPEKPAPSTERLAVTYFNPNEIMPADNIRHGLLASRILSMKEDILSVGKIEVPVEIRALTSEEAEANPTFKVRLVKGSYRHTAALELDKEGYEIQVPVVEAVYNDRLSEVLRQIAENKQRQDLTPMDTCHAIHEMFNAGATRTQVMDAFATPTGPKRELKPASNSWVNIMASFNDFPKAIQARIHDGRIGVVAAYELRSKYAKEDWQRIADKIEADRVKAEEVAAKTEDKFLNSESKRIKAEEKANTITTKIAEAEALVESTGQAEKAALEQFNTAFKAKSDAIGKKDEEKKAKESFTAAENTLKAAKESYHKAKESLSKLQETKKAQDTPKATKTPTAAPAATQKDVQTAAAAVGSARQDTKAVALKAADMRFVVDSIVKLSTTECKKTKIIGQILLDAFDGKMGLVSEGLDAKVVYMIAIAIGERKQPAPPKK